MTNGDFNPDQKRYLEGFVSGIQSARSARGMPPLAHPAVRVSRPLMERQHPASRPDPTPSN